MMHSKTERAASNEVKNAQRPHSTASTHEHGLSGNDVDLMDSKQVRMKQGMSGRDCTD